MREGVDMWEGWHECQARVCAAGAHQPLKAAPMLQKINSGIKGMPAAGRQSSFMSKR